MRGGDEVHTKRRRTIAATEPERKQNPLAGHETSKTVAADAKIKPKRDVQCQPHQKQTARNKNLSAVEEEQDEDSRLLEAPEPFYEVSIMPPDLSPHPRAKLQKALEDTAKKLRKHPTLPACPANAHEPWQEALSEVMAVALPRSYCAFAGCNWIGDSGAMRAKHTIEAHKEDLQSVTDHLPGCYVECENSECL